VRELVQGWFESAESNSGPIGKPKTRTEISRVRDALFNDFHQLEDLQSDPADGQSFASPGFAGRSFQHGGLEDGGFLDGLRHQRFRKLFGTRTTVHRRGTTFILSPSAPIDSETTLRRIHSSTRNQGSLRSVPDTRIILKFRKSCDAISHDDLILTSCHRQQHLGCDLRPTSSLKSHHFTGTNTTTRYQDRSTLLGEFEAIGDLCLPHTNYADLLSLFQACIARKYSPPQSICTVLLIRRGIRI
jgi:hypothetical protein